MLGKSTQKLILVSGSIFAAVLVGGSVLIRTMQNKMIYFPNYPDQFPKDNPIGFRDPSEVGLKFEDVNIETSDHLKLHGWLVKTKTPEQSPTILVFQGNAGNIGYRIPFIKLLHEACDANVAIIAYRGYSNSEGTPNEKGLQRDSFAILDHFFSRKDIDTERIFIIGSSLGGAVGVYAASHYQKHKLAGLILENTFTSLGDMVDVVLPQISPLKWLLLTNHWKSLESIEKVTSPILFISGQKDELIPPKHMQKLFDAAKNSAFKRKIDIENGTHNDTWNTGYRIFFPALKEFIEKVTSTHPRL